jgi:hypothetical protein
MPSRLDDILPVVATFAPLFSDRVWQHAQLLVAGALLARGKRTVTACLRVMGLRCETHFANDHHVLSRAVGGAREGSRLLLGLIVATLLPASAALVIGADDTLERRKGRRIPAKGCYQDAARSSHKHVIRCLGLRWVALMALVSVPFSPRVWALKRSFRPLPFLCVLSPPPQEGQRHKTSVDWGRQMGRQVRRWQPERALVLVVDGGYAAVALGLTCLNMQRPVTFVTRLRPDAQLYDDPPPPAPHRRGPKPKKGPRQPSLQERLRGADTAWEEREVVWDGGQRKRLWVLSGTGVWYTPGQKPLPIRWALAHDPTGAERDAAFACTDRRATAEQILAWVVQRWSVESGNLRFAAVTFEEMRARRGMETQRQWSEQAIGRTTPVLMGLFSLVVVQVCRWHPEGKLAVGQAAWYAKEQATFSDLLALVRRQIWCQRYFLMSDLADEKVQMPRETVASLLDCLCYAA